MKKNLSKVTVLLLVFSMICTVNVGAVPDRNTLNSSITATVKEIMSSKPNPAFGDEWSIIALARSGEQIPHSYYDAYYKSVEEQIALEKKKESPFTDDTAINDLERVIIALNAIGKDPQNVDGLNLVDLIFNRKNLADENAISGLTYALIAIDTKNYPEISGAVNTRESIIKDMLSRRTKDGGFSWNIDAETADLDTTAMAIQALYKYEDRSDVKEVINKCLDILKKNQSENGDYIASYIFMGTTYTYESPCTAAQILVALDNLKINPIDAANGFVKKKDLIDVLQSYYVAGGGYKNSSEESVANSMTTDQILYALDSYRSFLNSGKTLYDMTENKAVKTDDKKEKTNTDQSASEEVKSGDNNIKALENKNVSNDENEVKFEEAAEDDDNNQDDESSNVVETGDFTIYNIILIISIMSIVLIKTELMKKGNKIEA